MKLNKYKHLIGGCCVKEYSENVFFSSFSHSSPAGSEGLIVPSWRMVWASVGQWRPSLVVSVHAYVDVYWIL